MKTSMCKSKVYIDVRKIAPTRKHSEYNCSSVLKRRLYKGRHSFTGLIPQELKASRRSLAEMVTVKEFFQGFYQSFLSFMHVYICKNHSSSEYQDRPNRSRNSVVRYREVLRLQLLSIGNKEISQNIYLKYSHLFYAITRGPHY